MQHEQCLKTRLRHFFFLYPCSLELKGCKFTSTLMFFLLLRIENLEYRTTPGIPYPVQTFFLSVLLVKRLFQTPLLKGISQSSNFLRQKRK